MKSGRLLRWAGLWALVFGLAAVGAPAQAGVTGVCPDGSVFIVQREGSVPCEDAKRVEAHEVPPMRPEQLPRPYTWEIYEEANDPRNPYHLIDAAREVRALRDAGRGEGGAAAVTEAGGAPDGGLRATGPVSLGLDEAELRDLFLILELSQREALASFRKDTADGRDVMTVSLAHSRAFESRLRGVLPVAMEAGPALLFSAVAARPESFHAMFSFVQGHLAFHPDAHNPEQFGILQGHLGDLEGGEAVLGYVVLPASMDLARPMDVYWNDRRIETIFRP